MNMRDTDDPYSSSYSCDESDLEEYETRLYSMVFHNSNSYDDEPLPGHCTASGVDWSSTNNRNAIESTPINGTTDAQLPDHTNRPSTTVRDTFYCSTRNKASRLDQVKEIVSRADNKQSANNHTIFDENITDTAGETNRPKNMFSKKQPTNTDNPKTASLYFQNLTKSLNNVQYLQTVDHRLIKPVNSVKSKSPSKHNSPSKNTTGNSVSSLGLDKIFSRFPYNPREVNTHVPSAPVFKLDDRLFPNIPRNTSREEFELSHRLFSNKPDNAPVDRDRHNHLFNQLPTIPMPSIPVAKKDKLAQKERRRKKENLKTKSKTDPTVLQSSSLVIGHSSSEPTLGNGGIAPPFVVTELNSVSVQSSVNVVDLNDDPVVILETVSSTANTIKADHPITINLDTSFDKDVLVLDTDVADLDTDIVDLDSDAESVDSVIIVPPPERTPPPVIAIDESDDEVPAKIAQEKLLHPLLEIEHIENSFDFLDSWDDPDALRKSQVSLFSNLISNTSSRETLLDDRFFQSHKACDEAVRSSTESSRPADVECKSLTHTAIEQPAVVSVDSVVEDDHTSFPQTSVVNIDESSQTNEKSSSSRSFVNSERGVQDRGSGLVAGNSFCVDLEINITTNTNNSSNTRKTIIVDMHQSEATLLAAGGKRKRCQQGEEKEPEPVKQNKKKKRRKKPGKKAQKTARRSQDGFGMESLEYTRIEGEYYLKKEEVISRNPPQWTREMRRFYNDSWGGENFEVKEIQAGMSKNSDWRICWKDTQGPRWKDMEGPQPLQGRYQNTRCFKCSKMGHTKARCPQSSHKSRCDMCGGKGHERRACPEAICLECGHPNRMFVKGCWQCHNIQHSLCTKCIWKHDPSSHCFDERQRPVRPTADAQPGAEGAGPQPLLDDCDLRVQLECKRAKLGTRDGETAATDDVRYGVRGQLTGGRTSADEGNCIQRYFEKRRSCEDSRPPKYTSPGLFRKRAPFRRSRP